YFITVDPERDTQPLMQAYLTSFNPAITGLTGDPAAVHAMLDAYRVVYRRVDQGGGDYTMNHTASFYLLDAEAQLVGPIRNAPPPPTLSANSAPSSPTPDLSCRKPGREAGGAPKAGLLDPPCPKGGEGDRA